MPTKLSRDALLLLGFIMLMSLSLRGPVVGIAPIIEIIENDLKLSSSASGMLTTLPLLAFAIFAPLAAWLSRHQGIEKTLLIGALSIALGMVLRSVGMLPPLYLGVIFIGAGIAVGNVLLPVLLKRDFPTQIVQFTAIYVLMMNVGGTLMTGTAVPLTLLSDQLLGAQWPSWSFALGCQLLVIALPLILFFWLPKKAGNTSAPSQNVAESSVWRSPIAWLLTMFLALDSVINYIVNAWVPTIMISNGFKPVTAGLYHSYIQAAGTIPALTLPFIQRILPSKRQLSCLSTIATLISMMGFAFAPALSAVWSFVFGFGVTLGYVVGLSLISLRTDSLKQAAALSGMAQLVGYLLAAAGPVAMGALHDWQGSWQLGLYCLIGLCAVWVVLGWYASPKED